MKNTNKRSGIDNEEEVNPLQHEIDIIEGIIESRAKYRQIVQAAIAQWIKDFQDKRIVIKSVEDLKKLVELDIELQRGMRFEKHLHQKRSNRQDSGGG